ncbi:MAG: oligoribonuclease [Proteobacteria bacterium]|nr:oligoribonuclease [Pseudomonadota bacterium]
MPDTAPERSENLIWIDLEMTGLCTQTDTIIEIATIVTDKYLNELAEGPALVIQQSQQTLDGMDEWNTQQHGKSGLVSKVLESNINTAAAEQATLAFLRAWVEAGASPMCGNGICQDRRFLAREMPELETYFHYRNLDVSTLKILAARWAPEVARGFVKESEHLALSDIRDSIRELCWYREHLFDAAALRSHAEND